MLAPNCQRGLQRCDSGCECGSGFNSYLCCHNLAQRLPPGWKNSHARLPKQHSCRIFGQTGTALINYSAKATLRSSDDHFEGAVDNLYDAGATRNIATFYRNIIAGLCQNEIVQRAVDGALTCILGREAAARRMRLTMETLLQENKRLEVDLSGLKT